MSPGGVGCEVCRGGTPLLLERDPERVVADEQTTVVWAGGAVGPRRASGVSARRHPTEGKHQDDGCQPGDENQREQHAMNRYVFLRGQLLLLCADIQTPEFARSAPRPTCTADPAPRDASP